MEQMQQQMPQFPSQQTSAVSALRKCLESAWSKAALASLGSLMTLTSYCRLYTSPPTPAIEAQFCGDFSNHLLQEHTPHDAGEKAMPAHYIRRERSDLPDPSCSVNESGTHSPQNPGPPPPPTDPHHSKKHTLTRIRKWWTTQERQSRLKFIGELRHLSRHVNPQKMVENSTAEVGMSWVKLGQEH